MNNHDHTAQTPTSQERADLLFDELSSVLRHRPENPGQAAEALRAADHAFEALHTWMRAGNPLPQPWNRGS